MRTQIHIIAILSLFSFLPTANLAHAQGIGDTNGDALCDLLDVFELFNLIGTGTFDPNADLNKDGFIDSFDIQPMADLIQFGNGDMNRDGVIDTSDIPGFRAVLTLGIYDVIADMNRDGCVDLLDAPGFITAVTTGIGTH